MEGLCLTGQACRTWKEHSKNGWYGEKNRRNENRGSGNEPEDDRKGRLDRYADLLVSDAASGNKYGWGGRKVPVEHCNYQGGVWGSRDCTQ